MDAEGYGYPVDFVARNEPPNLRLKLAALLLKEALCSLMLGFVRRSLSAIR